MSVLPDDAFPDDAFPDDDVDFAAEHDSTTHADELSGGPEHAPDEDVPEGLAGADDPSREDHSGIG